MTAETSGDRAIRVFLVDDHALFRTGVKAELTRAGAADPDGPPVVVVGEGGSVQEAVTGIGHLRPDVVLLDVHMPDGGGAEVLRRVRPEVPDVVFLALSVSDAAEDVIAVIRAGARGYVTKTICAGCTPATRCSPRGWLVSSSTPSRNGLGRRRSATRRWIYSPPESATCCGCWPAATPTRRSPRSCSSRSRQWRRTSRQYCERPSCPTATNCPAGRPTAGLCSQGTALTSRVWQQRRVWNPQPARPIGSVACLRVSCPW
jgi:CheY-like chemotaxis protein